MAPATEALRDARLILAGHGAGGRAAVVERHARAIRRRGLFAAVRSCHLQNRGSLAHALAGQQDRTALVVPILMADGFTMRSLADSLAELGGEPVLCRPVGTHPGIAELLAGQAEGVALARSWPLATISVLVAAHGSPQDSASARAAEAHAERLRLLGRFAAVEAGFLDQAPTVEDARRRLPGPCVAVGLFVERGPHGGHDVPVRLAPFGADTAYAGPVGPCAGMADIIVARAAETVSASLVA